MTISIRNENYYPKPRICSEKAISCSVCLDRKKGDCNIYDTLMNEEDKRIINFRLEQIVEEKDYITKDKLIEIAKNYKINLTDKLLADYKKIGLIEPSIMKSKASLGIEGRGTVGFYKKNTPEIVCVIKLLLKEGFNLSEISDYHQMFIQGVISHIAAYGLKDGLPDSDTEKYYRVMVYFLAIDAKIDFTKYNLSKMSFKFEYFYKESEPELRDIPSCKKVIYYDGFNCIGEATY